MGERPLGMTLDRKDTNGNYEPSNCKWSHRWEQRKNHRDEPTTPRSKFIGVSWRRECIKWRVEIPVGGKKRSFGLFADDEMAAHMFNKASVKFHGDAARWLNPVGVDPRVAQEKEGTKP